MDSVVPVLLFVGIAVVAAVAVCAAYAAQKKRREELGTLAAELGWSFDPSRDRDHDDRYAQFAVFRRGHSRAAYNTLHGSLRIDDRDWPATMGDFTYKVTRSTGKSTTTVTYRFSYLILHLPWGGVPDLLIRPEGVFDKLAGAIGFDDIDFESSEFSRRFYVKSRDKRFAYGIVHPRMMEFLLASPGAAIDLEGGACCLADGRRRWSPDGFRRELGFARDFFDLWPDHLTHALDGRGRAS